jgi:two-component system NtrC family sensor kinase
MHCPRCQHENRQQAKFCEECTGPLKEASPTTRSNTDPKSEIESLRQALTEAVEQQTVTAELLQTRNRELADAQEQQTATSEILRVIATSTTHVQPVFAAVLMSAARLCEALDATIFQVDGDGLRLVAHEGPILSHPVGGFPLIRGTTVGRAVLDRRTIHFPDVQAEADEYPDASFFARSFGFRTTLSVPLLRGTEAIGAIGIRRTEVRPFTDRQIELLQTFAAQAVIAIENVRLFNETQETLEQQTATSEILRVIASSPTDVQPVFDAIARSAMRLCDGTHGNVTRFDGELLHQVAVHNFTPEAFEVSRSRYGQPPSRRLGGGRAILDRAVCHIVDVESEPEYDTSLEGRSAIEACWRCRFSAKELLSAPLPSVALPAVPSLRSRSSCSRRSPTRPSSLSRTSACSTKRRRRWSSRRRRATF